MAEGVKIERPDQAPFVAKVQAMHAGYHGTPIGQVLEEIRATP